MDKLQKNLAWIIPVALAVIVICSLAVSGHVSKNADSLSPTVQITVINEEDETKEAVINSTNKVTLVAVGDNLIHSTLISAGQQDDGSLDYSSFYKNMEKDIAGADIAIINQETVLGGSQFDYSGYPLFNTPWEVGAAAIEAGFDIFTCATNHSLDMGYSGIEQECKFFDQYPDVLHVGTYTSEKDYNTVAYYTVNNITFAVLNYTYGTGGISLPSSREWCVSMMDKDKITSDVTEAKENADVIIAFPHWGTENSTEITSYQEEYAQLFSDLGVDIVIGCNPHVLQDVKWIENESTGKKTLVYYSLGNFISHQVNLEELCGGMAKITITKNNDEISIDSAVLIPIVCWYSSNTEDKYDFTVYKLSEYTDTIASEHVQSGATPEYFTNLSEKIVSEDFLDIS